MNNVAFLKYVQAARVHYWEQVGIYEHFLETLVGPMLASTECQFKKPLFYPGSIEINTRMEYIKNSSFSLTHSILNQDGETAAEATDVMVMYDFKKNEKALFPDLFRKKVSELESREF